MTVSVACPSCGKKYQVDSDSLGRTGRCKSCDHSFELKRSDRDTPRVQNTADTDVGNRSLPSRGNDLHPAGQSQTLGRFQMDPEWEPRSGGFGTVYKAWDPVLERDVALKVPHPGLLSQDQDQQRYLREPKAAARLQHPNIVQVFDANLEGDTIYIASAFIAGRSLEDAIQTARLDFRRSALIVQKLAEALHYAHHQGVVHRDVKPANIMLDSKDEPMLMDFGLAQIQEATDRLSQDGTVLGTPVYMPPEQAKGAIAEVGPHSDQYSLGVVLYEMLTGERPFSGPPELVISLVINQEPERPSSHNPGIPRDLETICLKAMAKEPTTRYATCHDFAGDLQRWLNDQPIQARRSSVAERFSRWCRRNPLVAGLSGLSATLLVLATVVSAVGYANTSAALVDAKVQREIAKKKGKETERQFRVAERERNRAMAESRRAYCNYYVAQMNLTQRDWEERQIANVHKRLELTLPEHTNNEDLRGFEWYYWNRLCRSEPGLRRGHTTYVNCVAFSSDGRLASAGRDGVLGEIKIWDATTGQESLSLKGHSATVWSVAFSPDGTRLASASADLTVKVWDTSTGQSLWAMATGQVSSRLYGHSGHLMRVAFSPDGERLAAASGDKMVMVWDVATGKQSLTLKGHTASVTSVAFSPDGLRLASASTDETVKVWDAATGQESLTLKGHAGAVFSVVFSPDGLRLASASSDQTVKVWDAAKGQESLTLTGHTENVLCVAFSPDGQRLASAGSDQTVKVWDAATGQESLTLKGHTNVVYSVVFSPDGKRLASASEDTDSLGEVKVWDATSR